MHSDTEPEDEAAALPAWMDIWVSGHPAITYLATRSNAPSKAQIQDPRCAHSEQAREASHGKVYTIVRKDVPA